MNKLQLATVTLAISLGVIGCSQQNSPVESQQPAPLQQKSEAVRTAEAQGLQLLYLPDRPAMLAKSWETKKVIPYALGGSLDIAQNYVANGKTVSINVSLTVPKNALDSDEEYKMKVDDAAIVDELNFTFGPHSMFNTPVLLTSTISGLDLSQWTGGSEVYLYYFNKTTKLWELLPGKGKIDVNQGTFTCTKVKLPHFSQYGFGRLLAN